MYILNVTVISPPIMVMTRDGSCDTRRPGMLPSVSRKVKAVKNVTRFDTYVYVSCMLVLFSQNTVY